MFRNNHFSTLIRADGSLFSLITDIGFKDETTCVWETLTLTGNGEIVDFDFSPRAAPEAAQRKNYVLLQTFVIGPLFLGDSTEKTAYENLDLHLRDLPKLIVALLNARGGAIEVGPVIK